MIKEKKERNESYLCSSCGYNSYSWYGRCPSCGQWNTFIKQESTPEKELKPAKIISLAKISPMTKERKTTGVFELDRVLGNGFLPGEVILLTGEPGVGKTTLLFKTLQAFKTVYISGEESGEQIKERAGRLKINLENFFYSEETQIEGILKTLEKMINQFEVLVIDSIQTVYSKDNPSPLGSISQIKDVLTKLITFTKKNKLILIVIGHITKEGEVAGPKTLEHLVDCVLSFEGERSSNYRLLRAKKNRFGPTDEVGIFEMKEEGLVEVKKANVFIDSETKNNIGKTIIGITEGTRPLFFEIESLIVPSVLALPRRITNGLDYNKLLLLLAVIRKNLGFPLEKFDIYVNVSGGVSVKSPSADLGIVASLISSFRNKAFPSSTVFIGEVSLLGEIKRVFFTEKIIKEAERLGFKSVISYKNVKSIKDLLSFL